MMNLTELFAVYALVLGLFTILFIEIRIRSIEKKISDLKKKLEGLK